MQKYGFRSPKANIRLNNRIILVSAEHDTNGRRIVLIHQFSSVVVDIHLHLTNVLVSQLSSFKVDQNKAL